MTDADLPTMTEEAATLYYEMNAHRLDELFDTEESVTFEPTPEVSLVISVRMQREEADLLAAAARRAGQAVSTYLREAGLAQAENGGASTRALQEALLGSIATMSVTELAEALVDPKRRSTLIGSAG